MITLLLIALKNKNELVGKINKLTKQVKLKRF